MCLVYCLLRYLGTEWVFNLKHLIYLVVSCGPKSVCLRQDIPQTDLLGCCLEYPKATRKTICGRRIEQRNSLTELRLKGLGDPYWF